MSTADPFGFQAAINWDAVDEHADEIAAIFEGSAWDEDFYDALRHDAEVEHAREWCEAEAQARALGHEVDQAMSLARIRALPGMEYVQDKSPAEIEEMLP